MKLTDVLMSTISLESIKGGRFRNLDKRVIVGGTLVIGSLYDSITSCHLKGVKIVSEVPLRITNTIIRGKEQRLPHKLIGEDESSAIMNGCIFEDCELPEGHYETNYVYGTPTTVGTKVPIKVEPRKED